MQKKFKRRYTKINFNDKRNQIIISVFLAFLAFSTLGYSLYREKTTNTLALTINRPTFSITLNNQSATTAGTGTIYEKYSTGYYLNSNNTNQMTTSANGITIPTKTDYFFKGYYTATNGGGTKYIDANGKLTSNASTTNFTSNGTLYAYWEKATITVTFNPNKGSVGTTTKTVTIDSTYGTLPTPTRTGYNFLGWKYEDNSSNSYITSSTTVTKTTNHTLKARWGTIMTNNISAFDYTGNYNEFDAPKTGRYKIELWGAQGGTVYTSKYGHVFTGGLGGYTQGTLQIEEGTELFVYTGEGCIGTSCWKDGWNYNGGGRGSYSDNREANGNGGGATDLRLIDGSWDNASSLASRIMVAAGGGGADTWGGYGDYAGAGKSGGYGGGLIGGDGACGAGIGGACYPATGATQLRGGFPPYSTTPPTTPNGSFGKGGYSSVYNSSWINTSGGGGGYYGGSIGNAPTQKVSSASGGSSYISGYKGCIAITGNNNLTPICTESQASSNVSCSYHYSGYKFTSAIMIDGAGCNWSTGSATSCGSNQIQPDGSYAVGHSGNGYSRITYLGT